MYFEICNKKHCLINLRNISLQFQALIAKMILKQDLPKNCDSRVLHKICIFLANDLDSNEFDNFKWLWQLPTRCHAHSHHSAHLWGYLRFAGSFFSNLCIQVAAQRQRTANADDDNKGRWICDAAPSIPDILPFVVTCVVSVRCIWLIVKCHALLSAC